ncbi:MAG: MoxR family ATPase [Burkholderiaceae bacterium]
MLDKIQAVAAQVGDVVVGKQSQIRLALACVLARGHLLVEDVPGVGKTTLAHALSISLGLQFKRVQFTNDLLPADIVGVNVFDRNKSEFVFHPGPVFSPVLLADEINRATPKTQSALLEAMEERQISVDGRPMALPDPFFVIATQNPQDQIGTFALPESQLDRFLMCIELGYPDPASERALLGGEDRRAMVENLKARISAEELLHAMRSVRKVQASSALLDYVQQLLAHSRQATAFSEGLSPRAGLALLQAAKAWAMLDGRNHVLPDDVQAVLLAVAGHRLRPAKGGHRSYRGRAELVAELVQAVPIP